MAKKSSYKENIPDIILHLAAQVAVTTSIQNPRLDFETNALGTFNLLEGVGKSLHLFCQSCIYGPHQFGIEDQGWVAWTANKFEVYYTRTSM